MTGLVLVTIKSTKHNHHFCAVLLSQRGDYIFWDEHYCTTWRTLILKKTKRRTAGENNLTDSSFDPTKTTFTKTIFFTSPLALRLAPPHKVFPCNTWILASIFYNILQGINKDGSVARVIVHFRKGMFFLTNYFVILPNCSIWFTIISSLFNILYF